MQPCLCMIRRECSEASRGCACATRRSSVAITLSPHGAPAFPRNCSKKLTVAIDKLS